MIRLFLAFCSLMPLKVNHLFGSFLGYLLYVFNSDAKKREAEINSIQQINYLLAQVDLLTELVALYLEQGALAEEKVIEEQIKFNEARGQKSLVLAAKSSANLANLTYLQAAGTYQKIVIDYKAAIDQLYN